MKNFIIGLNLFVFFISGIVLFFSTIAAFQGKPEPTIGLIAFITLIYSGLNIVYYLNNEIN